MIDYVKRAVEIIAKNIVDASGNIYLLSGEQGIGKQQLQSVIVKYIRTP